MAYSYALLELNESLRAIKQESATDPQIVHLSDALYAASEEIQNDLGRNVVKLSTKHWIEYHERSHSEPTVLRVLHWPIQTDWGSLEIAEDSSRAYGATTVLTSGTDYRIVNEGDHTSKIERISGDSETTWLSGYEAIRITFKGGWALADIPPPIKRVCRKYTALLFQEVMNQEYAFERVSDDRGSVTRFAPAMLMKPMLKAIAEYRDFGATTCVRFTEEDDP